MKLLANPTLRLFIGAVCISLSPVWVRLVDVSPTVSGFYRVLFGAAALVVFLVATRRALNLSKRVWWLLALAAVFLLLDLWFWHRSILYIGPGLATLLANFQVFVMVLLGIVILKEKPGVMQMIAIPLALFGLALIVGFDWGELPGDYKVGVVLGFLTAVSYAFYIFTLRYVRSLSTFRVPIREMSVISVFCAVMLAIVILAEGRSFAIPSYEDLGLLVAYGVVSHCIGWLFIASSLSEVSSVEAGLALLLQPALSFAWDALFFGRALAPIEFLGAGIALAAIYLGTRAAAKQA